MKIRFRLAFALASLGLASTAFGADPTQPLPTLDVKQLPAAVQTTLEREGARISKVQQATDTGTMVYEATVSKDGRNYSLLITRDGTILSREEDER